MAYCRMGEVAGGMIDGVSAPGLGIDLSSMWEMGAAPGEQWIGGTAPTWNLGPLTTTGATPAPLLPAATPASGVPELLARPAETGGSGGTPWLLFAGLGLVAYLFMK
jgi:hypothetical protein